MRLVKLLFLSLSLVLLSGCASIFFNDYKQVVRVISDPPGADIYNQNGEKLGVTPAYVKVRRAKHSLLKLQLPSGEIKSAQLDGQYRWSPSFYGNLVFSTLAPIGWATDYYLTDTAFQFKDAAPIKFKSQASGRSKNRKVVAVIAPPQSEWNMLSREVAEILVNYLRDRHPNKDIKDYQETRYEFVKFHYTFDHRAVGEELNKILYATDADQYVESSVEILDVEIRVKVAVKDAFTHETIQSFVIEKPKNQFAIFKKSNMIRSLSKYFAFFPNAVGVDFGKFNSDLEMKEGYYPGTEKTIVGKQVPSKGLDQWLGVFGSLNISYIRPPRREGSWDWRFMFIPSAYLTALTFRYDDLPQVNGVEFRRFRVGMGYGAQGSVSSRYGMIYVSLVPTLNFSRITWSAEDSRSEMQFGEVLYLLEGGYQLFVSESLAFRIFGKTWMEDSERWSNILSDAAGTRLEIERPRVTYGGVSILWYWPGLHDKGLEFLGFN